MPIYECHCSRCDLTFEVLAKLSGATRTHPCPECGKPSPRVVSTFAIASGDSTPRGKSSGKPADAAVKGAVRQPSLCQQYPHIPLLCHMDEASGRRWVAHFNGRGAEYDDKMAERAELRKKRGLPPPAAPSTGHSHAHSHSPAGEPPAHNAKRAKNSTSHGHDSVSHSVARS